VIHEETTNAKGETEKIDIVEKIHDGVVEEITIDVTTTEIIQEKI
jgi:hypothetical protein